MRDARPSSSGSKRTLFACLATLLLFATLFRLPPLYNANAINSDAAVVGLQAMHMLRGEWAFRLWGAAYQGVVDSAFVALFFRILGPTPLAVYLVPFTGLLVMITLAFDVLRRRLPPISAATCVMPLVFSGMANNTPMIVVMRQTLATTLVLGIWLADGAATSPIRKQRLALSGACFALGIYIDSFAVVSMPACAFFWVACAFDLTRISRNAIQRAVRISLRVAAAVVAIFAVVLIDSAEARKHFGDNASLFFEQCLPFALCLRVFVKGEELHAVPWKAPLPILVVQVVGAAAFLVALGASMRIACRSIQLRTAFDLPWQVRRLGLFGLLATASTVTAFLVSGRAVDMWSARYLAPVFWFAPFTLAPLAYLIPRVRLLALLSPFVATTLVGGWLSYGGFVDGPRIRLDPLTVGNEERALLADLRSIGVRHVEAHYWIAYRLTFITHEDVLAVPIDRRDDRYPPYRHLVDEAPVRALVFNSSEPRAKPEPYVADLEARGVHYERREAGGFVVLVVPGPRGSTSP